MAAFCPDNRGTGSGAVMKTPTLSRISLDKTPSVSPLDLGRPSGYSINSPSQPEPGTSPGALEEALLCGSGEMVDTHVSGACG